MTTARWLDGVLVAGLAAGIIAFLHMISRGNLSGRESLLLSLFLTGLSVVASWILSRYYSEVTFNKSQRTFALKAAEKVNNLSNELDRLSSFLHLCFDGTEELSPEDGIRVRDGRIEGAIHIISTLKSMNDTSLSDWQGVIGEELKAQRAIREEREEDLKELVDRIETLDAPEIDEAVVPADETTIALREEIESIKSDLRLLVAQAGGTAPRRIRPNRAQISRPCPACGATVAFRQRPKDNSVKSVTCPDCNASLYSRFEGNGFALRIQVPVTEAVTCPACDQPVEIAIDPVPGSEADAVCSHCGADYRAVRSYNAITTRPLAHTQTQTPLSQPVLDLVQSQMPAMPWSTNAAAQVAAELGLPVSVVSQAIQTLAERKARVHADATAGPGAENANGRSSVGNTRP